MIHTDFTKFVLAGALLLLLVGPSAAAVSVADITVTTTSDVVNGDVATVASLNANPGPDGISLREAIQATNNDPGAYTVRFAPAIAGTTIFVGSSGHIFPPLTGGGVTIEGDIDGEGTPDVTLRATGPAEQTGGTGFQVSSSGNRLHALVLEGFQSGVDIRPINYPLPSHRTFADNVVSDLVIRGPRDGILLQFYSVACGMDKPPCETNSRWVNTTITGNTIETRQSGIHVTLAFSTGDRIDGLTVTDNTIRQRQRTRRDGGPAIQVDLGGNATRNRVTDVLIARNSIDAVQVGGDGGITVAAGLQRAQANTIDRVRILDNRVHVVGPRASSCCYGIDVYAGTDTWAVGFRPVNHPDGNIVRNVHVTGNSVSGSLSAGVRIMAGAGARGGGSRNRVENVRIGRNVIRSTTNWGKGVYLWVGDNPFKVDGDVVEPGERGRVRPATGNRITDVTIDRNRIRNGKSKPPPDARHAEDRGGIVLLGGFNYGRRGVIRGVRITRNRIATPRFGIRLIGGLLPTARGNSVSCVRVAGNRITGSQKPVSVVPNLKGAKRNRASLGGC